MQHGANKKAVQQTIYAVLDVKEGSKEKSTIELTAGLGIVWRIVFADHSEQTFEPVASPIGRFHHSEQVALYTS